MPHICTYLYHTIFHAFLQRTFLHHFIYEYVSISQDTFSISLKKCSISFHLFTLFTITLTFMHITLMHCHFFPFCHCATPSLPTPRTNIHTNPQYLASGPVVLPVSVLCHDTVIMGYSRYMFIQKKCSKLHDISLVSREGLLYVVKHPV